MPQPILRTARLLLIPLADRHLELEVQLDSDPEVLRYLYGRARSEQEVISSHTHRMELGAKVDGLGYWVAFGSNEGQRGSTPPAREDTADFVGLMMLPPTHGPDQPDDPTVAELGYRLVRRCWRQGLASEASHALVEHAFDTARQDRVIAQTMAVPSGRAASCGPWGCVTYADTSRPGTIRCPERTRARSSTRSPAPCGTPIEA